MTSIIASAAPLNGLRLLRLAAPGNGSAMTPGAGGKTRMLRAAWLGDAETMESPEVVPVSGIHRRQRLSGDRRLLYPLRVLPGHAFLGRACRHTLPGAADRGRALDPLRTGR
jgi:hypothetical protein